MQKTFTTKNCLVTLNELHKTLVAGVDEVNGQQNTSPSIYYYMPYVYYHKNQQLKYWHMVNEKGLKKNI